MYASNLIYTDYISFSLYENLFETLLSFKKYILLCIIKIGMIMVTNCKKS